MKGFVAEIDNLYDMKYKLDINMSKLSLKLQKYFNIQNWFISLVLNNNWAFWVKYKFDTGCWTLEAYDFFKKLSYNLAKNKKYICSTKEMFQNDYLLNNPIYL